MTFYVLFQVEIKQKKSPNSRRNKSLVHHLQCNDGTTYQVCKSMFCATVSISTRTIGDWINNTRRNNNNSVQIPSYLKLVSKIHYCTDIIL